MQLKNVDINDIFKSLSEILLPLGEYETPIELGERPL